MATAAQLLAWSLVLVPALLPASPLPQPFSSERHSTPRAAGASLGPGWVQELAEWPPLGSPSEEALWTRQDLLALSPLALAAPGGSLVFSGAGEPDDELWRGSNPAHSAAIGHDAGTPPAPAGSSALPPPAWPLLLGADDSQQTLEVPPAPGPAGTAGAGPATATFRGHTGLGSGSWPFTPTPGSGAPRTESSPGALAFESRERPSGSEPRSLQPAFPSPARPPGAESSPGPAGQDRPGTAGTPHPRPTVSTVTLAARPGSAAGASSAEGWQAADAGPGSVGQEGQPVSWAPGKGQPAPQANVPREPREPLEHVWEKGRASYTRGYSLPPWGNAQGLPPHPTGRDGQPQPEAWWVPGASLAARPQQTPGAGGSMAGMWPGLPPAVLSAGRLAEPAPPAHGSPTWRLTPAWTETRAPAWTEGLSAHQRSTRRALPGSATQPPHLPRKAAPGAEQGAEHPRAGPTLHTSLGTSPAPTSPRPGAAAKEEIGAPQRVRGAVDPRAPVNATSTAPSAPRLPPPGTLHSDLTKHKEDTNMRFLRIATALAPKSERDKVWSMLSKVLKEQHSHAETTEPEPLKRKINFLLVASDSDDENEHGSVHTALDHYRAASVISMDACPLEWWLKHERTCETLGHLARKHLVIPVTTAPCERLFSLPGDIVNKKQAALSPVNVTKLVWLSDWLKKK